MWAAMAVVGVAAVLAYLPALRGGFIWDDDAHVTESIALRSLEGLRRIWVQPGAAPQYYPMVHTAFWVQYQLFGEHPLGYKLVNLALHLTTAGLLIVVLRQLGLSRFASVLSAAVFALHPVHVESVAWITELKNTLSGAFYMGAAAAYLRWRGAGEAERDAKPRAAWWWAAVGLFVAAVLSKSVTASLPAGLLLAVWWQQGRLRWSDVRPLLPLFVIGAGMGIGTAMFEKHVVGAQGEDFGFSMAERLLIAGRAVWFYAGKLVWPHPLVFTYPRWVIDTGVWWQWLYPAGAGMLVAGLALSRKRLGRGPLVCVLFFGGTLLPAIGFLDVYPFVFSFVADHFQYLASLGLIVLGAAAVARLHARVARAQPGVVVACIVALGVLASLTYAQGHVYRDLETLYRHVLARNDTSWMAHNNLASVLIARGDEAQARRHVERALELRPKNAGAMRNLATILERAGNEDAGLAWRDKAHAAHPGDTAATVGLAQRHLARGDRDRAEALFRDAAEREPRNLLAHYHLGLLAMGRGDAAAAVDHLGRAVAVQGDLAEPRYQYAQTLMAVGRTDEAVEQYRAALAIAPDEAPVVLGLGNALASRGDADGAVAQFRRAIELSPDLAEAHYNLGLMLAIRGQADEAAGSLQRAAELDPGFAEAWFELGTLRAKRGELDAALADYRRAIEARPGFAEAHNNLGVVLTSLRRPDEAAAAHRRALELKPGYADARMNLGVALADQGRFDEADAVMAPLTALPDAPFAAMYQHALALVELGRTDAAADLLTRALKRQPDHVDAALQLAEVQLQRGQRAEARTLFASLVQRMPDSPRVLRSLAWLTVTDPGFDPQAQPLVVLDAIKLADRAHRLTGGEDARSLDVLAATHAAAGRFTEALRYAQLGHDLAEAGGDVALARAIAQRQEAYRAGRRWVDEP